MARGNGKMAMWFSSLRNAFSVLCSLSCPLLQVPQYLLRATESHKHHHES